VETVGTESLMRAREIGFVHEVKKSNKSVYAWRS
jgi:hypothetical protein